jgi:hypothetical protein
MKSEFLLTVSPAVSSTCGFFNAAGQLILEKNLAGSADRIPVRQLPAGLYSCVFQDEKTTFHKKFVKY